MGVLAGGGFSQLQRQQKSVVFFTDSCSLPPMIQQSLPIIRLSLSAPSHGIARFYSYLAAPSHGVARFYSYLAAPSHGIVRFYSYLAAPSHGIARDSYLEAPSHGIASLTHIWQHRPMAQQAWTHNWQHHPTRSSKFYYNLPSLPSDSYNNTICSP